MLPREPFMPADVESSIVRSRDKQPAVPATQSSRETTQQSVGPTSSVDSYAERSKVMSSSSRAGEVLPIQSRKNAAVGNIEQLTGSTSKGRDSALDTTNAAKATGSREPVAAAASEIGIPTDDANILMGADGVSAFWQNIRQLQAAEREARRIAEAEAEAEAVEERWQQHIYRRMQESERRAREEDARERRARADDIRDVNEAIIRPLNAMIQQVDPQAEPIPKVQKGVSLAALSHAARVGHNAFQRISEVTQYGAAAAATTAVAIGRNVPKVINAAVEGVKGTVSAVKQISSLVADSVSTDAPVPEEKVDEIAEKQKQKSRKKATLKLKKNPTTKKKITYNIGQVIRPPNRIAEAVQDLLAMPSVAYGAADEAEQVTADEIRSREQAAIQLVLSSSEAAQEAVADIVPSTPAPTLQRGRKRVAEPPATPQKGKRTASDIQAEEALNLTPFRDLPDDIREGIERDLSRTYRARIAAENRRRNRARNTGISESNIIGEKRVRRQAENPSSGSMKGAVFSKRSKGSGAKLSGGTYAPNTAIIFIRLHGTKAVYKEKGETANRYATKTLLLPKDLNLFNIQGSPTGLNWWSNPEDEARTYKAIGNIRERKGYDSAEQIAEQLSKKLNAQNKIKTANYWERIYEGYQAAPEEEKQTEEWKKNYAELLRLSSQRGAFQNAFKLRNFKGGTLAPNKSFSSEGDPTLGVDLYDANGFQANIPLTDVGRKGHYTLASIIQDVIKDKPIENIIVVDHACSGITYEDPEDEGLQEERESRPSKKIEMIEHKLEEQGKQYRELVSRKKSRGEFMEPLPSYQARQIDPDLAEQLPPPEHYYEEFPRKEYKRPRIGSGKPCWEGYEMIGMKQKGNKEVPNCVPIKGGVQSDYAGPIPKQIKEQKKRAAPTRPRKPRLPKESREGFDDDKNEMYGEWDNNLGNLKENDLMQTETQEVRYHKDFKGLEKRLGLEKRAKKLKSKGWINEPSKPIG